MSQTNRNFTDKNKSEAVQEGTSKAAFELGITTSREGESGVPSRGETPMEIARLNSRNDERMQYSQLNLPDATERILNKLTRIEKEMDSIRRKTGRLETVINELQKDQIVNTDSVEVHKKQFIQETGETYQQQQPQTHETGNETVFPHLNDTTILSVTTYEQILEQIEESDVGIETITEHEFVKSPLREVEKAFIKYHQNLRIKEHKNELEKSRAHYFKIEKLPSSNKIENFGDLLNFLKLLLYYKFSYFLPDYNLRTVVIDACNKIKDKEFNHYISITININTPPQTPIPFTDIITIVSSKVPQIETTDLPAAVKQTIQQINDVQLALLAIKTTIQTYCDQHHTQTVPTLSWIAIWKTIIESYPKAFDTTVENMSSMHLANELRMIKMSNKSNTILANNLDIDHIQAWTEFADTFTNISKVTTFNKPKTKTNDTGNTNKKGNETNKKRIWFCDICGEDSHNYRKCSSRKNIMEKNNLKFYQGNYRDMDGNALELAKGEYLIKKYPQFDPAARPEQ